MIVINTVEALRKFIKEKKRNGDEIGLVPTMGYLHEGHISLVEAAKKDNQIVVVSIFVNPTQFGEVEDLNNYPIDIDGDSDKLSKAGVDVLFLPKVEEMYPEGYSTYVNVESDMTNILCGSSRIGHFKGVSTIVAKLFNMVAPNKAYFGQKDAQQVAVIERMVIDLNFDIKIVPCPIFREKDGLAMSSRNTRLNENERKDAVILHQSLIEAKVKIENGEKDSKKIIAEIIDKINTVDYADIDYVEIVDALSLKRLDVVAGTILIALAVKIGKPRLIDNLRLEVK